MDDAAINRILMQVASRAGGDIPEDVQRVFKTLVSTTLSYRDQLKQRQVILTVEDVQAALDGLVCLMQQKPLPESFSGVRLDLIKLWIDELKVHKS